MVPGPGYLVPSTAEISAPPNIPWAVTLGASSDLVYSWSMMAGLASPDMMAKSWMSSRVRVWVMLAESPTLISSKGRFSMTSRNSLWLTVCSLERRGLRGAPESGAFILALQNIGSRGGAQGRKSLVRCAEGRRLAGRGGARREPLVPGGPPGALAGGCSGLPDLGWH